MNLFLYTMTIDDPQMDSDIIKVIDDQQDRQKHETNVKAQMTEWRMYDQSGFKQLADQMFRATMIASMQKYRRPFNPIIGSMWGVKYVSGEYTTPHDHWPATWGCSYYINPPEDGPTVDFFSESEDKWICVKPTHGLLIVFEGHVLHRVEKKIFEGTRYVVAANVFHECEGR